MHSLILLATVLVISAAIDDGMNSRQTFFIRVDNSNGVSLPSDAAVTVDFHKCSRDDECSQVSRKGEANVEKWDKLKVIDPRCPPGFTFYGQSCYECSRKQMAWEKAKTECTNKGASLVKITSVAENTFLSECIGTESWIGLYRATANDPYSWIDNEYNSFINWEGPILNAKYHCVMMLPGNGKWRHGNCTTPKSYTCEHAPLR